ncbi:MAG: prolyl oligopeptidase family serine peptidase, partial [Luteibaculum sp.]
MKLKSLSLLSIAAIAVACSSEKKSAFVYPETKQVDSSRVYFGDTVPDPYAWLEDDYSEETMAWVDQQNKLTRSYLDTLSQLQKLKELMPKYWKYASYSSPKRTEAGLFYWYSDGVMNQPQLMRKTRDGQESVVLDPNSLSEDGTASINSWSVSEDGKYLAYGLSKSGSDWAEIFIKDINTGELLPDRIQWVKFSGISWDKEGFYYSAFPAPKDGNEYSAKNEFHRVFYHKLGATEDQLIYEDAQNAQRTFSAELDDDLKYLMVYGAESTSGNSISVRSAAKKTGEFTHLVLGFEHDWSYVGSYKKGLLFLTNYNAPNNQIVWIDPEKPQNQYWKTIVAEREQLLQGAVLAKDHLALNYLTDVVNSLELFELGSAATEKLRLEGKGNVGGLQYDKTEGDIYFHYEDYINPGLVYKYNIISEQLDVYKKPELPFNPENFVVEQVFYPSKDGTRIPLFIVHKKGLAKSPETPCFLYAYGGFNIAIQPHFKPDRMAFLEAGGIYAVANIRGGSEYGEAWHESGTKFNK